MEKLNNHIKSDKAKWIVVAVALTVMFVLLGGLIAAVVTDTRPQDWGKKEVCEHKYADGVCTVCGEKEPAKTENVQIETKEQHNMLLSVATTAAEVGESHTDVVATIIPAAVYDETINWSIKWADGNDWATGKNINDYLSVVPYENNPAAVTVTCKQAFGCQAILKAECQADTSVFATCTVDYRKKVTELDVTRSFTVNGTVLEKFVLTGSGLKDYGANVDLSKTISTTIGTLNSNATVSKVEIKISEQAVAAFTNAGLNCASEFTQVHEEGDRGYVFGSHFKSIFGFNTQDITTEAAQNVIGELLNASYLSTDVFVVRITLSDGFVAEGHFGLVIEDSALVKPSQVQLSNVSLVF